MITAPAIALPEGSVILPAMVPEVTSWAVAGVEDQKPAMTRSARQAEKRRMGALPWSTVGPLRVARGRTGESPDAPPVLQSGFSQFAVGLATRG